MADANSTRAAGAMVTGGLQPPVPAAAPPVEPASSISLCHVATALVIVLAAVVRLWAAEGDPWLDEIWSVALVSTIDSPWKVFTELRHDNNHHLMSLWFSLLGFEVRPLVLRAPSLFAGLGTLVLGATIARRWGLREMFLAAALLGSSYVMVNYNSEARGYSPAGFFALGAIVALEKFLEHRSWLYLLLFWLLVPLGFLSHLTFLHFYLGTIAWSVVRLRKTCASWPATLQRLLILHGLPVLFLTAFYFMCVRNMEIGGGDSPPLLLLMIKTLSLSVGGPLQPSVDQLLIALLAAAGGLWALVMLARGGADVWILFAVTVFLSPLVLLVRQPSSGLFVRYFYINIVFFLLLLSYLLGRISTAGNIGTLGSAALLLSTLVGNTQRLRDFAAGGRRGEYLAAVRYILDHSTETTIQVGVDHPRTRLTLHYYTAFVPSDRLIEHDDPRHVPTSNEQWYLVHMENQGREPVKTIEDDNGNRLDLAKVFRHSGLSGFDWALYRRAALVAPEPPR